MIGMTPAVLTLIGRYVDWTTHDATADDALGVLNGDAALAALEVHDERDDAQDHQDDDERGDDRDAATVHGLDDGLRQTGHDVSEDDQAHAVADAALGDELTDPHDEHRARDERADDHDVKDDLGGPGAGELDTKALEEEEVAHGFKSAKASVR